MLTRVGSRRTVFGSRLMGCRTALTLIALAVLGRPVSAQRVRGVLTDSATHEPLGGALITLSDATGAFLAHGISDPSGAFAVLRLEATHTMRVVRIGFKPRDVVVPPGDTIVNLRLEPIAPLLPVVASKASAVCKSGPESDAALELWEQARNGLLATVVAREVSPLTVHLHRFTRNYDAPEHHMVVDSSEYDDLTVDKSFVAARTPIAFAAQGYLLEYNDGRRDYYAPDEEILIDPAFVAQHCLRRVDGADAYSGQVGIAFAPIADAAHDTLVDITGTLWLDREHPELRELDFHCTNLEPDAAGSGAVLLFTKMPNGVSMVSNWRITSTRLAISGLYTAGGYKLTIPRPRRVNTQVLGYDEMGGEIMDVDWRDTHREITTFPNARGQVVDARGIGVPGVRVWMKDSKDTTRTDDSGYYALPRTRPGIYYLLAADSLMASESLAQTVPTRVALMGTGSTTVSLTFHPRSDVLASICPSKSYRAGTSVLRARVVDSHGRPAANARIDIQLGTLADSSGKLELPAARQGEADFNGIFTICGIPPAKTLVLRALKDGEGAGVVIDQFTDDVAVVTIPLAPVPRTP
jgi:hypothetical protein